MNYAGSSSHEGVFLLRSRIPLSQLFSVSPTSFLHSLFHSFLNSSYHLNHIYLFFYKSCLPPKKTKKTASLPPHLLLVAPRAPHASSFLLSSAPTNPFFTISLSLSEYCTHTLSLSLPHHLSVLTSSPWMEC